jgi:NAD(P)-dependent dehydrogenase (short-subunit alcohol dehydrogenase family)
VKTIVVKADGGNMAEVSSMVKEAIEAFGGLDVIIGNHGWTRFSDFNDLNALSEAEWDKCWKTNVLGMKQLVSEVLPTFNANPEGGVVIITSSIAGKSIEGSSMAYSVTKAAQLHLVKCMAKTQGSKLRMNAVLPGLLLTDWGNSYGEERIAALKNAAALKKEVNHGRRVGSFVRTDASQTEIGDCADMFISLAKNTSITGQHVHVGKYIRQQPRGNFQTLTSRLHRLWSYHPALVKCGTPTTALRPLHRS